MRSLVVLSSDAHTGFSPSLRRWRSGKAACNARPFFDLVLACRMTDLICVCVVAVHDVLCVLAFWQVYASETVGGKIWSQSRYSAHNSNLSFPSVARDWRHVHDSTNW